MNNLANFQKTLISLKRTPYKLSSAYKKYGDITPKLPERSTFWETHIGYIAKYEYAKFQ